MEEVGEPYVNVTQLIEAVLHDQLMEDHTRYVRYNMQYMLNTIKNACIIELSLERNASLSSDLIIILLPHHLWN